MRKFDSLLKGYLLGYLKETRKSLLGVTQEKMIALLRITVRSYSDLERGEYCFSATTLLLFLGLLPDEMIVEIVRGFSKEVIKFEEKEVA